MTTETNPGSLATKTSGPRTSVIHVSVGYPWSKRDDGQLTSVKSDERWQSIAKHARSVGEWVKTSVSRRAPAPLPFDFQVGRLRGTHGQMLLNNLRERIRDADILIMDIGSSDGSSLNCNVLIETGMALAFETERLRDTFILKPRTVPAPTDLNGFLFTDYEVIGRKGAIKINDVHGFQAALRGSVIRMAREREMIGSRLTPHVEVADDDPVGAVDQHKQTPSEYGSANSSKSRVGNDRARK